MSEPLPRIMTNAAEYLLVVSRVIGLPGDQVMCCDFDGRMEVDGQPLVEGYLPVNASPSQTGFAVTLKPGQMWVMGDNRAVAIDSRTWGPLPMTGIVGRVIEASGTGGRVYFKTPEDFIAVGLAPVDRRFPLPLVLLLAAVALLTVIVQGTVGRDQVGDQKRQAATRPVAPADAVVTAAMSRD